MKSVNAYSLTLVKEKEIEYEGRITTSDEAVNIARVVGYDKFPEEHMGMFCLNNAAEIVGYHEISHGDMTSSHCHPRDVFKRALIANASSILLVHNHTSGNTTPSESDIDVTERIKDAGKLMGIPLIDHIIIGHDGNFTSLKAMEII